MNNFATVGFEVKVIRRKKEKSFCEILKVNSYFCKERKLLTEILLRGVAFKFFFFNVNPTQSLLESFSVIII